MEIEVIVEIPQGSRNKSEAHPFRSGTAR